MASLVLKMSMSLDGYVAPPDGGGAWIAAGSSEDSRASSLATVEGASAHLVGSVTYGQMAAFYPTSSIPFTPAMNRIPKVVFSNSLTSAEWGPVTIAAGDLGQNIRALKQEYPEGYLLAHAGPRFVRSLIETGLVDEYRLFVHPVVLGGGERIFTAPLALQPISTTAFSGGVVAHTFTAHR